VNAISCAVEIQRGMQPRNEGLSEVKAIRLRIGINLGDVIVEGDDVFGAGVNVAARIESIAPPAGVAISGTVRDHLGTRLDLHFEDIGEQMLKNMDQPIRVYLVSDGARSGVSYPTLPDKPSIAVLPFDNMSGDPEQDYFVDGLVEDIITALSRVTWFFVIARNSSFTYKGRAVDVRQVGRELGVRYVLEGSVRKAGNRLRISGQLIDTATGSHIWADRFDGEIENIFDLQDKITASVAGAIQPKLLKAEIERAQTKPTGNLNAYDLYLQALALAYDLNEGSYAGALGLLQRAITIDRRYSSAYGLGAYCHQFRVIQGWGADDEPAQSVRLARLAIETGRDDPQALAMAGFAIAFFDRKHEEALAQIERALTLNVNAAQAWANGGWIHCWIGNHEKSVECFENAIRLSPLDPLVKYLCQTGIGHTHFFRGRSDEAIIWTNKALSERPTYSGIAA
jgi:TolB-like protein